LDELVESESAVTITVKEFDELKSFSFSDMEN